MSTTSAAENPAPGYVKKPDHSIVIEPLGLRLRVILNGEIVADTAGALAMNEDSCPTRYYLPREDVRTDLFAASSTDSYCPFKGAASYWTFSAGGETAEDAAWSYEAPYDEMLEIKGYFSFYEERVDQVIIGEPD